MNARLEDRDMEKHDKISEQEIRDLAFQFWIEEGKPENRELDNWLDAERSLYEFSTSEWFALIDEVFKDWKA